MKIFKALKKSNHEEVNYFYVDDKIIYKTDLETTIIAPNINKREKGGYLTPNTPLKMTDDLITYPQKITTDRNDLSIPKEVVKLGIEFINPKAFENCFRGLVFCNDKIIGTDVYRFFEYTNHTVPQNFIINYETLKALNYMNTLKLKYRIENNLIEITDGTYTVISILIKYKFPEDYTKLFDIQAKKYKRNYKDIMYTANDINAKYVEFTRDSITFITSTKDYVIQNISHPVCKVRSNILKYINDKVISISEKRITMSEGNYRYMFSLLS